MRCILKKNFHSSDNLLHMEDKNKKEKKRDRIVGDRRYTGRVGLLGIVDKGFDLFGIGSLVG